MLEIPYEWPKLTELDYHIYKFPILTFLAKLTSFNFGWGVLRWVAWTIWSDACLLDQITYAILSNIFSADSILYVITPNCQIECKIVDCVVTVNICFTTRHHLTNAGHHHQCKNYDGHYHHRSDGQIKIWWNPSPSSITLYINICNTF